MHTLKILLTGSLLTLLGLSGCGGGDSSSSSGGGGAGGTGSTGGAGGATAMTGMVSMTFALSKGAKASPALVDPLKGTVYGSLYKQEDVTAAGPIDGAMEVASVEVADVDLTTLDVSAEMWMNHEVPVGSFTFLGFYDLDGNGSATFEPDAGDPVTLPSANKFDVTAGQETALTATFDLVLN